MRSLPSADVAAAAALRAVQRRFLAALREGGEIAALGFGLFLDPPTGTAEERWVIYREGYRIRLTEAIENDYPAIARITGAGVFRALCRRYLAEFPPRSHDIGRASQFLADYLPGDPVAAELPFLSDLARFEWALAEARVAPDQQPLRWSDLADLGPERLADTQLPLAAATVLIRSTWPLDALWNAKGQPDGEIDISLMGGPTEIVVWREGLAPRWRRVGVDEAALIDGVLKGATPAALVESGTFGDGDDASTRLITALRHLVDQGAFSQLPHSGDAERAPLQKETS